MTSQRKHVGLVFGGVSGEHEVSIRSASTVLAGLTSGSNPERYAVTVLYIDREGLWWGPGIAAAVLERGEAATDEQLPHPLPPAGFRGLPQDLSRIHI